MILVILLIFKDWADGLPERKRDKLLDVEAVERCEKGICPRCGGRLEFLDLVEVDAFEIEHDYGAGYLAVRGPPLPDWDSLYDAMTLVA